MQKVGYYCDHCQKLIGEKRHISLRFGQNSGIATPPGEKNMYWQTDPSLAGKFVHFCTTQCLSRYVGALMNPVKAKIK